MKIVIEAEPKEIAALVVAIQGRDMQTAYEINHHDGTAAMVAKD